MKLLISLLVLAASANSSEDNKWVWGESKGKTNDNNRSFRYQVNEYPDNPPQYNSQFRPQYPGPYGPDSRPITPGNGAQVLVGPDGPTGIIGRPDYKPYGQVSDGSGYRPNGPVLPGANIDPILSGPVPLWIREDKRYQDYDTCKCSYGFNCPGLKFGSCGKDKQYCCYDSRKLKGVSPGYTNQNYDNNGPYRPNSGDIPFKPFNAIPSDYYSAGPYRPHQNNHENGHHYNQQLNGNYNKPYPSNGNYYGNGNYNGNYQGPYQGPNYGTYRPNSPYNGPYAPDYDAYNGQNGGFNWQRPNRFGTYEVSDYARSAGKAKNSETKENNGSESKKQ